VFRAWIHCFGVPKLWSIHSTPLDPKWSSGVSQSIWLTFDTKKMQNLRPSLNAQFWVTKVVKHPFYSIGPKMMFGSVSEHFNNLRQVKRFKTCVSGLNALFRGTEVVRHPFYSIGHKMMFGSVSDHFTNIPQVKKMQNMCFEIECTISRYRNFEASILLHWTQNDVWDCFRAFR
jgi:hypothetical protein